MVPDDVVERHLRYLGQRGRAAGTIYARRRAIARMSELIPVPLLQAADADLARWRDQLAVIDNTAVHYVSHARGFFRWAAAEGLCPADPTAGLLVPPLVRGLPRPIGEEDIMRAVVLAPPRIRPWLVLAGWAGLRAKEIALLRRERVLDTAQPPVLVIAADATKGHRERAVPMSSFVLAELRAAGLPRAGYVFRRADGRPGPNRPAVISHAGNRYLKEIGADATMHQLRHRFGTMTYRIRRDLRLVQELLGHADPATTAGYAAVVQAEAADVVEALPVPPLLRAVGE